MANHFFQPQSSKISVDEFSFADILKGKRVKLTLKTASYLGVVLRVNPNKSVALTDVVDVKDGRRFPGVKLFFGNEIVNVESCGETNSNNGEICITESEGILKVTEFQPYINNIISDDNNDNEYVKFQIIDEFTEKFGLAVMHIRRQDVIGVAAEGVEPFQHGRLCWLQIATGNKVHLFDILLLGAQAFKNGLAAILQSRRILKVVHDCRGVASSLQAQFGVNLRTVFDTQVADVMCFHSDTGGYLPDRVSTLQEVVSLHLKVPSSRLASLRMKTRLTQEEREILYTRPCPLPMLKVMALAVIHLQPLRVALLDAMMADYVARVDAYLCNIAREPGAVEHIAMGDVLELPRELRELEHIRKDRQRRTIGRFNVTQSGLLDRFNPLSKTPPITKPRPQTPAITKPRPQTPPTTTPLSQTPPITKPLSQIPPITTPLYQTPPITTPPSNTPSQATPLLKTAPSPVEASWVAVPRMQAGGANHAPHAEPPPIAGAVGLLHVESPASSPQVTRASSPRPSAPTPAVTAAGPPPAAAPRPSLSPSSPGMSELLLGIIGRGRPLSEAPRAPLVALPSLGRGFMLQKALASSPVSADGFPPGASEGADASRSHASPRWGHP